MNRLVLTTLTSCFAVLAALLPSATLAQQLVQDYFASVRNNDPAMRRAEQEHLKKGFDSLGGGRPAQLLAAKIEFDAILNHWPNHPRVLALQAHTLMRMGQADEVDAYFDRAYQMTPTVAELYIAHGFVLLRRGKVAEAIRRLQQGVKLDANSVDGHYNLGLALVRAKRFEEANRHAQLAYALGHPLPGLRDQLKRANAWRPETGPSARASAVKEDKNADK